MRTLYGQNFIQQLLKRFIIIPKFDEQIQYLFALVLIAFHLIYKHSKMCRWGC